MVIELRLHESLRSYIPSSSSGVVTVDVIGDITVKELLEELEIEQYMVGAILVNGQKSSFAQLLYDGDKISLLGKGDSKAE